MPLTNKYVREAGIRKERRCQPPTMAVYVVCLFIVSLLAVIIIYLKRTFLR
ncbi:hypothetical protein K470DRAFT_270405 [Piedraia hortae CBS 480.64]|uniref:Uncharacterized protein n=1 Tax=Piedraia hortae CBS 480.64 TaxID=1314780 RepID=A0A6A7C0D4_9PEZI|nr:hypothetical protein K470DRAFT_270405 [Piedraia hortae CBS 480.64]